MPVTRQIIVETATFVAVGDEIDRATREKKSIRPWRHTDLLNWRHFYDTHAAHARRERCQDEAGGALSVRTEKRSDAGLSRLARSIQAFSTLDGSKKDKRPKRSSWLRHRLSTFERAS